MRIRRATPARPRGYPERQRLPSSRWNQPANSSRASRICPSAVRRPLVGDATLLPGRLRSRSRVGGYRPLELKGRIARRAARDAQRPLRRAVRQRVAGGPSARCSRIGRAEQAPTPGPPEAHRAIVVGPADGGAARLAFQLGSLGFSVRQKMCPARRPHGSNTRGPRSSRRRERGRDRTAGACSTSARRPRRRSSLRRRRRRPRLPPLLRHQGRPRRRCSNRAPNLLDTPETPVYPYPSGKTMAKTQLLTTRAAQADRKWHVVDVAGLTLGRASTQIAALLRGKHKPTFARTWTAATSSSSSTQSKVALTGQKAAQKRRHTATRATRAVSPPSPTPSCSRRTPSAPSSARCGACFRRARSVRPATKLKVYAGSKHPHAAQQPSERKLAVA